jgi:putative aldouronate transport system permease protein
VILYPLIYCVSASLSGANAFVSGKVSFLPVDFSLAAYKFILREPEIWIAYGNTVFYTAGGTAISVILTILGAYPLSKARVKGVRAMNFLLSITLWFSAGTIPVYLNIVGLGLNNTRAAMLVAFACSAFDVILLRTFFKNIPPVLEEAAKIDGANDFQVLLKIVLPVSVSAIATISLFYAVGKWNSYFWAMVLLHDQEKIPLQVLLQKIISDLNFSGGNQVYGMDMSLADDYSQETVLYATIVISIIPMLAVYPFIQKYFVSGIMIGSIKG